MGEAKKPVHGQIRIDKDGSMWVAVEKNTQGNHIKSETITPDSIRDKELDDLRRRLRKAKYLTWILSVLGLIVGAFISWALMVILG